jgi:hypothetical protein
MFRQAGQARTALVRSLVAVLLLANAGALHGQDLLASLAGALAAHGIGVRTGAFPRTRPAAARRIELGRLAHFPVDTTIARRAAAYERLFGIGATREGVLLAARPNGTLARGVTPPASLADFTRAWNAAPRSQRVFISFARDDAPHAAAVREVLQAQGYVVFTYLRSPAARLQTNAVEVGRFLGGAGEVLVIDSPNARQSVGVHAEASVLQMGSGWKARVLPIDRPDPPRPRTTRRCCRWCTFREPGHVRIGCQPVTCGPQCRNPRS